MKKRNNRWVKKKNWEKLERDPFATNSIKQDKALTSNGSFNLSKFWGRTQGLVTEGKCYKNLSYVRALKGLKARCQKKRQSLSSLTRHSYSHTTSLGDLVVTQWSDAGNVTWPEASWPDKPVHQMIRRADARKELKFGIPDLSHLYLHGFFSFKAD